MGSLADLYVDIHGRTNGFDRALSGMRQQMTATKVALATFAGNVASTLLNLGTQFAGDAFRGTIGSASELNAVVSKTKVIFGDAAASIIAEGDAMAASFGASKTEYVNAAASFGSVFKGLGKSQGEAAALGVQLAKLGMDLASFDGTTNEEAFTAISSALRGEMDPIEKFRVFLSADKIEAEALASGLAKTKGEITDMAKKQATLNLILRQTTDAQGDLLRTAGDSDNQFKKLTGSIQNIATSIGTYLLPAVTSVVVSLNGWVDSFAALGASAKPTFDEIGIYTSAFVANARASFGGFFEVLGRIGPMATEAFTAAFGSGPAEMIGGLLTTARGFVDGLLSGFGMISRNVPAFFDIAVLKIQESVINIGRFLETIPANAAIIGEWLASNWSALVIDGVSAVGAAFSNLGTNLYNLGQAIVDFFRDPTQGFAFEWTPLLEGFKATAEQLPNLIAPSLVSLQDQIDEKIATIGAAEGQRAIDAAKPKVEAAVAAATAKAGPAAAAAVAGKEFKSESLSGSEFARKLQSGIFDSKDKTPERQLKELEAIAVSTGATATAIAALKFGMR